MTFWWNDRLHSGNICCNFIFRWSSSQQLMDRTKSPPYILCFFCFKRSVAISVTSQLQQYPRHQQNDWLFSFLKIEKTIHKLLYGWYPCQWMLNNFIKLSDSAPLPSHNLKLNRLPQLSSAFHATRCEATLNIALKLLYYITICSKFNSNSTMLQYLTYLLLLHAVTKATSHFCWVINILFMYVHLWLMPRLNFLSEIRKAVCY